MTDHNVHINFCEAGNGGTTLLPSNIMAAALSHIAISAYGINSNS